MQIVCPHCATPHDIPDGFIGPAGRKVRCSGCRAVFLAERPEAVAPAVEAITEAPVPEPTVEEDFDPTAPWPEPTREPPTAEAGTPDAPEMPPPAPKPRRAKVPLPAMRWRMPSPQAVIIAASALLLLCGIIFRTPIVRAAPQMGRLYAAIGLKVNLRGLEIARVTSRVMVEGEQRLLVIEGEVSNSTRATLPVPPLRFAVRNHDGVELYVWTAKVDRPPLEPGEVFAFRRRLAAPPGDAQDVLVRFAAPEEIVVSSAGDKP